MLVPCALRAPAPVNSGVRLLVMQIDPWNSLEITKILAGLLTPLVLACVGIYVHRVTKRYEHTQWQSQKLIEKRLAIYDDLAPHINDLLCYFTYVGLWRDLDPPEIVKLKRVIDKKIYLGAPLFSADFFVACMEFQNKCYETYNGWGRDASLKTKIKRRREARPDDWKPEWEELFSTTISEPDDVRNAYRHVMEVFARDIGVHASFVIPTSSTSKNCHAAPGSQLSALT
jgi:hypothetical protein